ncbi:hypothetical protein GCM10022288_26930 [Gryllotalpicola kribbensis]|uniref:SIR2-like domain-containing protein n=2 Tax=Gryllotalpicola kribbensis TaxID=993084 RepID=A0ABP8AY88_9MICO
MLGALTQAVEDLVGTSGSQPVFRDLQRVMLAALDKSLAVDGKRLGYLTRLLTSSNRVGVVTLNYDLTIETASEQLGLAFETGVQQWRGGYEWSWNSSLNVRLLKLHGSLNWFYEDHAESRLAQKRIIYRPTSGDGDVPGNERVMIFGTGSKLRHDGPFLAMYQEFQRLLAQRTRLIVIGYSFRDDHVNEVIRRWVNTSPACEIVVIDPALEHWSPDAPSAGPIFPFYGELHRAAARDSGFTLTSIPQGAAVGLRELFG